MSSIMRRRSGLMGFSLIGFPVLRLECLNPSILKTERPPVTCARSNSYCGRRNRPTAPPAPPARAGSFSGREAEVICSIRALPVVASRHSADGLTFPILTTDIETQIGTCWFRDKEQSVFAAYVRNRTHRRRLFKRSTEPDFN